MKKIIKKVNLPSILLLGSSLYASFFALSAQAVETIHNPVKSETFIALAFRIMQLLLGAAAGLAIVFIMVGAVQLMISRGNPEQVTRGKDTIVWAVLGLFMALFAFSLIAIIQNLLGYKWQDTLITR